VPTPVTSNRQNKSVWLGCLRIVCVGIPALTVASCRADHGALPKIAILGQPAEVPVFGLFEFSLASSGQYRNPFIDTTLEAVFTAPDGARIAVPGFYYGEGRWMVRFRPYGPGHWTFGWSFAGDDGLPSRGVGRFQCNPPTDGHGRIRNNPANPNRWIFEDGQPYFPIGFQEGVGPAAPSFGIDGESRTGPRRAVSIEDYFRIYGQAGFNLFRFSQRNNTYSIFDDLDHYRERESIFTDRVLRAARQNGVRVMLGFFGYYSAYTEGSLLRRRMRRLLRLQFLPEEALDRPYDARTMAKEKRFIRYSVARWGAYADFWELLNERKASPAWTGAMATYTHSIDPDRKPVSTSWETPVVREIDIDAPHWYQSENESDSDIVVLQKASGSKQTGKPVIVGEQGNTGMNWDPASASRMRIRAWTALFQEIGLIFWNTSWSKAGMFGGHYSPGDAANIYLGPVERQYIGVLGGFSARLDAQVEMTDASVSDDGVRAYALLSPKLAAAYLHHFRDHTGAVTGVKIALRVPEGNSLVAEWIDPASGAIIGRTPVHPGNATLLAPPFRVDAAVLVTR
jgi:hypothetical protein